MTIIELVAEHTKSGIKIWETVASSFSKQLGSFVGVLCRSTSVSTLTSSFRGSESFFYPAEKWPL